MSEQPVDTTLYSLSDAAPAPAERREGERHLSLFRVGAIDVNGHRELCLIRNISAGGMMIRPYCELKADDPVTIELKTGTSVPGRVTWVKDGNAGVTFDQPVDVVEILSSSMQGPKPRMPRIAVDVIATVRDGARIRHLPVCDVSQGGVKLESDRPFQESFDISITLPGLPPQPAALRWYRDGHAGLTFNKLLPLSDLVAWLKWQRDESRAA